MILIPLPGRVRLLCNSFWLFLLQIHAPKGGFEIFCVEKPKPKVRFFLLIFFFASEQVMIVYLKNTQLLSACCLLRMSKYLSFNHCALPVWLVHSRFWEEEKINKYIFHFQASTDLDQDASPRLSCPPVTVITVAEKDVPASSKPQPDIPKKPETSTASVPVTIAQQPCSYVPVAPAPFDGHKFEPKVCV